jgi:hypothetical protein
MRKTSLGIILVLVIGTLSTTFTQSKFKISGTYTNAIYLYSIGYDAVEHYVEPGWNEKHFYLRQHHDKIIAFADVIPITNNDLKVDAIEEAKNYCAADGPDGSSWCESADSIIELRSKQGLRVIKFYQIHISTSSTGQQRKRIGPYYAIDISHSNSKNGLLIMHDKPPTPYLEDALRQMVDTIRIISIKQ